MPKYIIQAECYYGEKNQPHRFYQAGDEYDSDTLKPSDAPSFFKLVQTKAPISNNIENEAESATGLTYPEMKKFVKDNNIDVDDLRKETLEKAILDFQSKATITSSDEVEKLAGDLKTKIVDPANNEADLPITQNDE